MSRLRVSDHALLRFLQRVGAAAAAMGGGDHYILADERLYLVRDGVVVTVLDECSAETRAAMIRNRPAHHERGAR